MKYLNKRIFFFTILFCITNLLYSQTKSIYKRPPIEEYAPFYVEIKKGREISVSSFSNIQVIDARPDTSRMAVTFVDMKLPPVKMVFPGGTTNYLSKKLNSLIDLKEKGDSVLIMINDLWFTQTNARARWLEAQLLGSDKQQSNLFINMELFHIQDGKYFYAGKIDTVLTDLGWIVNNCHKLITNSMRYVIDVADKLCASHNKNSPGYELSDIKKSCDWESKYPVLGNNIELQRGIFHTYDDFIHNRPDTSIKFSVVEENYKKLLTRYRLTGDSILEKAWGYSDSTSMYMHLDSLYYPIRRFVNTFEVPALETIEIINTLGNKILSATGQYFMIGNPFKILALEPFLSPKVEKYLSIQLYHLNLNNGLLR